MHPSVVGADDEGSDRRIQLGKRQAGLGCRSARLKGAGPFGQQLRVDGAEQPFDLAPALGPCNGRVDQLEAQVGCGLVEMEAGEVRAVINVQDVGNAAHGPVRLQLAPDCLA